MLTNHDLEKMVDTSDEWIVSRTGIRERRIADPDMATSDLAVEAARRALKDAGVGAEELDLIIVATVTPDMFFPATACIVQDKLGAVNAAGYDLSAGCSGFVYALDQALHGVRSGAYNRVLVIGADVLTRITDFTDRSTCVLFGDAAGAVVVGPVAEGYGVMSTYLGADGGGGDKLRVPAGGSRMPFTEGVDPRARFIHMQGNEVFKFAVRTMVQTAETVLQRAGLPIEDLDLFIPHQANIRIIDAAVERLNIDPQRVFVNVARYGNTSAASVPVALDEAKAEGRVKEGDHVLMMGFGAGLTWGGALLRWGGVPS